MLKEDMNFSYLLTLLFLPFLIHANECQKLISIHNEVKFSNEGFTLNHDIYIRPMQKMVPVYETIRDSVSLEDFNSYLVSVTDFDGTIKEKFKKYKTGVVFKAGELLGFVIYSKKLDKEIGVVSIAHVNFGDTSLGIAIHPHFRGHGLGKIASKTLLQLVLKHIPKDEIAVTIKARNKRSTHIWKDLGLEYISEFKDYNNESCYFCTFPHPEK